MDDPSSASFLFSLRSLFSPAPAPGEAARPAPVELPAGSLRLLPAMPRAPAGAQALPGAVDPDPGLHPLRRVAGSAGRWKKRLVEAKATWPRTTIDELIATGGHIQKLAGLIQERYGLDHEAAEKQVLRFLGEHDGRL